jgi:predicted MFS family arabinose efflux permease
MRDRRVALVALLCAGYMISQFLRAAIGVLAPDLRRDLGLAPEALGLLSGAFFLAFASAQLPVGILLDRYGPRRTLGGVLLLAVAGCLLFAASRGASDLIAAQALMGGGCSCVLMGTILTYGRWFAPERISTLAGLTIAIGSGGTLLATAPLALAAAEIGWRAVFLVVALLTLAVAALTGTTLPDAPSGQNATAGRPESLGRILAGLGTVLRDRQTHTQFAMQFVSYGAMIAVLGLWGAPYLADVHGLDAPKRGRVLFVMASAVILGTLAWGPADRWTNSRKRPVLAGAVASGLVLLALAALPQPPVWLVTVLFALLGALNGYIVVLIAHGRASYPEHLVGRGITVLNIGSMGGAALLQMAAGTIIGAFPTVNGAAPALAYRCAFAGLGLVLLLAALLYRHSGDVPPSAREGAS